MKKVSLFLIGIMIMSGISFAQSGPGKGRQHVSPEIRAEKMTERMVKEYSLNESQAEQLKVVNLEFAKQLQKNHGRKDITNKDIKQKRNKSTSKDFKKDKNTAEMKEMRTKAKEAFKLRESKLKKILTNEQYAQYEKNKEQKRNIDRNKLKRVDRKETRLPKNS